MKKSYFLIPIILLFCSCNIKEQSEIQKEVIASTESITIDAKDLLKSFVKDSAGSAEKYVGKILSIKGEVGFFEQFDTIAFHKTDSLPGILKWILNRVESDINTSNIFFEESGLAPNKPPYKITATFPREYRKELAGIKEKSKVTLKGKLEHLSMISQTYPDSTKKVVSYIISLQGCILEKKK